MIDSTTEEVIGTVPGGDPRGRGSRGQGRPAGFETWSQVPLADRLDACSAISAGLAARAEEAGRAHRVRGRDADGRSQQIQAGLPTMQFGAMAQVANEIEWEQEIGNSLVVREPIGVVGAITPWNFPLNQLGRRRAGDRGRVLDGRQAERGHAAQRLRPRRDHGGGRAAGRRLQPGHRASAPRWARRSPRIPTSTWSRSRVHPGGRSVSEAAAGNVKRVSLELGGKSANVILDDADLKAAVSYGVANVCLNSGQVCSAHTRMLVPRDKLAEAEEIAKAAAEKAPAGRPLRPRVADRAAGLRRPAQAGREYIEKGEKEGAKLVTGGADAPEGLDKGYFVRPTVFSDVKPDMTIAQEEIFGPVLSIIPYDDEDEARRSPTAPSTGSTAASGPPTRSARRPSPGGCAPARSRSTARRSTPWRRSAASSSPGTGASSGASASRSSSR